MTEAPAFKCPSLIPCSPFKSPAGPTLAYRRGSEYPVTPVAGAGLGHGGWDLAGRPALCPAQCALRMSSSAATVPAWPLCSCVMAMMTAAMAVMSAAARTRPARPASSGVEEVVPASLSAGSAMASLTARTARMRLPSFAGERARRPQSRLQPVPPWPSSPAAVASAYTWAGAAMATATARTSLTRPTAVSPLHAPSPTQSLLIWSSYREYIPCFNRDLHWENEVTCGRSHGC